MGGHTDDRDPHGINSHLKVTFQDVIAEPEGIHSCECVWTSTECCYECWFNIFYGLPSCLTCLCNSSCLGVIFGVLSFWHVWLVGPFVSCARLLLRGPMLCWSLAIRCLVDPWCEASSYLFMFFANRVVWEMDE